MHPIRGIGHRDTEKRKDLMAKGEKLIQDEGVTIQPYWRSLYNHTRTGLEGVVTTFPLKSAQLSCAGHNP